MTRFWRVVAVACIMCQSALPALSCPCPSTKSTASRSTCAKRPVKAAQPKPLKSKCARCSKAKHCASKKATVAVAVSKCASGSLAPCSACPYRQAKSEPVQPYVPAENSRDQGVVPVTSLIAAVLDVPDECCSDCSFDIEGASDVITHNERQAQIVCWLK